MPECRQNISIDQLSIFFIAANAQRRWFTHRIQPVLKVLPYCLMRSRYQLSLLLLLERLLEFFICFLARLSGTIPSLPIFSYETCNPAFFIFTIIDRTFSLSPAF